MISVRIMETLPDIFKAEYLEKMEYEEKKMISE
jgi:hypothetical protein